MTQKNKDLIEMLDKDIETRILPKTKYPYVPASAMRSRLNEIFGCLWDTKVLSSKIIDDEFVLLELRLMVTVGDDIITKEGFGSSIIQKYVSGQNKGKMIDLGDAYNNAVTDAIKACAKQLGIGNKQLDVKKDPVTGDYVQVSKQTPKNAVQTKPDKVATQQETKQKDSVPDDDAKKNEKILELKKKLAEKKNKEVVTSDDLKKEAVKEDERSTDKETVETTQTEDAQVSDHGFDYTEVGEKTDSPKNTQKLVIVNLAKMQRMDVEDYIEKIIEKRKPLDELTSDEAGLIVRSGLTTTYFDEQGK